MCTATAVVVRVPASDFQRVQLNLRAQGTDQSGLRGRSPILGPSGAPSPNPAGNEFSIVKFQCKLDMTGIVRRISRRPYLAKSRAVIRC